jgi:hypothetical protein
VIVAFYCELEPEKCFYFEKLSNLLPHFKEYPLCLPLKIGGEPAYKVGYLMTTIYEAKK